jgi:DNA replication protein DnaC
MIPSSRILTTEEIEREELQRRAELRRMVAEQLPSHLQAATFDRFNPDPDRKALQLARQWTDAVAQWFLADRPQGGPGIMLTSERQGEEIAPGCGKSFLAASSLLNLAERGIGRIYAFEQGRDTWCSIMWTSSADLIAEVRSTYNRNNSTTAEEVIGRYNWADVLVLDDVGTEPSGDDATAHLFRLIDSRIGRPTFFTSNYSTEKLRQRSPEWAKLVSRMRANLKGALMTGPDRRAPEKGVDPWARWKNP